MEGKRLALEGLVASPDGTSIVRDKVWGAVGESEEMGQKLAELIMAKGGRNLLDLIN
jgi:hydroxymethylbilane synthase